MTDNNGNKEHMADLVEKVLLAVEDQTYEDGLEALTIAKHFLEYTLMKMAISETMQELFNKDE